jgi:hypothetical protein
MAEPLLTAAMPEALILDDGYTVTLDAVDPATGASVSGVVVSGGTLTATKIAAVQPLEIDPPLLAHQPQNV